MKKLIISIVIAVATFILGYATAELKGYRAYRKAGFITALQCYCGSREMTYYIKEHNAYCKGKYGLYPVNWLNFCMVHDKEVDHELDK